MVACAFQLVSAIDAAPTVRFDFDAAATGTTAEVELQRETTQVGMPPLNRALGLNAMTDGGFVSSSAYGLRTIHLDLLIKDASPDRVANTMQALWRELNRPRNILKWHPEGATKPVFFRTFRTAPEAVSINEHKFGRWRVQANLLAEPFAYGLRETLGPFTVNNDPAAGSNPHYFDVSVSQVLGDVPTPCVITNEGANPRGGGYLAVRQHGNPGDLVIFATQAESFSLLTDTTNPGAGPDPAMSGTGTNNFVRTSFTTNQTLVSRLTYSPGLLSPAQKIAAKGVYRLLAVVRRSDATSVIRVQGLVGAFNSGVDGDEVTLPLSTSRQLIDLGIFNLAPHVDQVGHGLSPTAEFQTNSITITLKAARDSGGGTLDWDYVLMLPADESMAIISSPGAFSTDKMFFDGVNDAVYGLQNGSTVDVSYDRSVRSGALPRLVPNQANRIFLIISDLSTKPYVLTKTDTGTVNIYYWPQYLYVRPAAS